MPVLGITRVLDTATGRVRWFAPAFKENFNDNTPYVAYGDLVPMAIPGTLVLKKVSIRWRSTTCGAGITMVGVVGDPFSNTIIGSLLSTALVDDQAYWDCWIPAPNPATMSPTAQYIYFSFSGPGGGHLLDDLWLSLEFETYPQLADLPLPEPAPVSLEGYRWPLKRAL